MYLGVTLLHSICQSPNSFSHSGSYFKYRGEGSQIFRIRFGGGLSGRVSSEASFDVQLVVCMGECTQIFWIRFVGQQVSSM